MHDDDTLANSAVQDSWKELAEAVRLSLLKRSPLLHNGWNPEEMQQFVDACREAYFLEVNAATFGRRVQLEQERISAD